MAQIMKSCSCEPPLVFQAALVLNLPRRHFVLRHHGPHTPRWIGFQGIPTILKLKLQAVSSLMRVLRVFRWNSLSLAYTETAGLPVRFIASYCLHAACTGPSAGWHHLCTSYW